MKNDCWGIPPLEDKKELRVCLMISRKKDNKKLNIKERRKSFVTYRLVEELKGSFEEFIKQGVKGEFSRLYISVNLRDEEMLKRKLIHMLVDDLALKTSVNIPYIEAKVAGLAAQKDCAAEKKWMFDFDATENVILELFVEDVRLLVGPRVEVEIHRTPHGFAIITSNGFQARFPEGHTDAGKTLMEKWGQIVSLKRDALLCVAWGVNK